MVHGESAPSIGLWIGSLGYSGRLRAITLVLFRYINGFFFYRRGFKKETFGSAARCTLNIVHMRSQPRTTQENAAEGLVYRWNSNL